MILSLVDYRVVAVAHKLELLLDESHNGEHIAVGRYVQPVRRRGYCDPSLYIVMAHKGIILGQGNKRVYCARASTSCTVLATSV